MILNLKKMVQNVKIFFDIPQGVVKLKKMVGTTLQFFENLIPIFLLPKVKLGVPIYYLYQNKYIFNICSFDTQRFHISLAPTRRKVCYTLYKKFNVSMLV